jgi:hypothetical protein
MEINGNNFTLKYGLRAMFAFEEMTGKPFEVKSLLDTYCFCYSCIIANQDNPAIDFNEFIDWCDIHPETIEEFHKFMDEEMKKRDVLGNGKKKVTRKTAKKN